MGGERIFLFSSESVNEGHPDKICDQVSDAVLDACLICDPKCKVACETCVKDNMVMVAGEITVAGKIDYETVVRGMGKNIGFDSFIDDLSSVDSKGLNYQDCEVLVRINKQSPDIAGGVHVGKDDLDVGAGDQGIMFGYASDETEDAMPLTHSMATRLGKKLTDEKVIRKTLEEIILKNGQPALTLYDDSCHLYVNPSGKFIIGAPFLRDWRRKTPVSFCRDVWNRAGKFDRRRH